MYIADWFRSAAERRQLKRSEEAYLRGYADAQQGKPPRPPGNPDKNGPNPADSNVSGRQGD